VGEGCELIVVLVAQVGCCGIHDVPDLNVGSQAPRRESVVEGQGAAAVLVGRAGDVVQTRRVGIVLPDAPLVVDEAVVHEEDGVTGRRGDVGHDAATGADTVVAVGVRAKMDPVSIRGPVIRHTPKAKRHDNDLPVLHAGLEVAVPRSRPAGSNVLRVALGRQRLIQTARQAAGGEAAAGSDVACCAGEDLHTAASVSRGDTMGLAEKREEQRGERIGSDIHQCVSCS